MITRAYIAGPITGLPDFNKHAFDMQAMRLRRLGFDVVNPHEIPRHPKELIEDQQIWRYYMRRCVALLATCDEVHFLPGWEKSQGAQWEHKIAAMMGLSLIYIPEAS